MAYSPIKISELLVSNPANTLDGSEAMPAIQGSPSGSVALTVEQIREFVLTSGTPADPLDGTETVPGTQGSPSESVNVTIEQIKDFVMSFAVAKAGDTMTGVLTLNPGDVGGALTVDRSASSVTGGASIALRRQRPGSAAILSGDWLFGIIGQGWDGAAYRSGANFSFRAAENYSSSAAGTDFVVRLASVGSLSLSDRFISTAEGHLALGTRTNLIVGSDRSLINRTTTLAGLSGFTHVLGKQLLVTDIGGGNGLVVSDGTSWRRAQEIGTNRRTTDAAFTLAPLTDAPDQLCTGTLTADRAITLSTTNVYDGARFRITRTGAGAFNYTVAHNGGTKNIATDQWAEFVYYSALSAWQLAAAGSL